MPPGASTAIFATGFIRSAIATTWPVGNFAAGCRNLSPTSKSMHRFEELDGLRAFALLGVMYTHFVNDDSMLGSLGVYLFFVLSGYLISGILLRCRGLIEAGKSTLTTVLKTFYIRRALRILPVYYLFLFGLWFAGSHEVREQFWWHVTFNSNSLFVFIPFTTVTPHLWTLALKSNFTCSGLPLSYWRREDTCSRYCLL
jgi:peptidoglycan/LPS O-acetylase OafA/YrhL